MFPNTIEEPDALQAKYTKHFTEKEKEDVIDRFKKANPKLMELTPKVKLQFVQKFHTEGLREPYIFDPPIPEITVDGPFLFDNPLAPLEFEGIEVTLRLNIRNFRLGLFL